MTCFADLHCSCELWNFFLSFFSILFLYIFLIVILIIFKLINQLDYFKIIFTRFNFKSKLEIELEQELVSSFSLICFPCSFLLFSKITFRRSSWLNYIRIILIQFKLCLFLQSNRIFKRLYFFYLKLYIFIFLNRFNILLLKINFFKIKKYFEAFEKTIYIIILNILLILNHLK